MSVRKLYIKLSSFIIEKTFHLKKIPILSITQYSTEEYFDGSPVSVCFSLIEGMFSYVYFIGSIVVFFVVPLGILIFLYALIASSLMSHPTMVTLQRTGNAPSQSVIKYRKQVIMMLGTVVLAFFVCLLPFRALTFWIILAPAGSNFEIGFERYYNILYFSRIMFHINSAVNPILYNIMSSKFRGGFVSLCGAKKLRRRCRRRQEITRKSTTSSSTNTTSHQTSESFLRGSKSHPRQAGSLRAAGGDPPRGDGGAWARGAPSANGVGGQKPPRLPNGEIYV